jgi:hypothetical protein
MSFELPLTQARRILGLGTTFATGELERAYRAMVRAHPPDRDAERFREIRAAYDALRRPLRVWDDWLTVAAPHSRVTDPEAAGMDQRWLGDGADLLRAALTELLLGEPLSALLPATDLDAIDRPLEPGSGSGTFETNDE